MITIDNVRITADNTNVFNDRLGAKVPAWAKRVRIQLVTSDNDWTWSASIGGNELARDSAPNVVSALTLQKNLFP